MLTMNKSCAKVAVMPNTYRLTMSLTDAEGALCDRVQKALEKKMGVPVPYTNVVRLALKALAKQEKVK